MHAPKSSLENLLEKVKATGTENATLGKDNAKAKVELTDYEFLKRYDPNRGSKAREIRNFISDAVDIVFGVFSPFEDDKKSDTDKDSESGKLDIAQGGKSESDEETEQKRKGLKIMAPKQMITRLPILLAQLKADNNSQKLKNEIKQIAYSLYR